MLYIAEGNLMEIYKFLEFDMTYMFTAHFTEAENAAFEAVPPKV